MENKKKYLLKNTLLFSLSNFSSKLVAFLLVPLYTYKLSTHDYGVADLLFTICGFLFPFLSFNIIESVFRFSIDKDTDKNAIINAGLKCNLICAILGLLAIPVLSLFDEYRDYAIVFYFYLVTMSLSQTFLSFLKGQEKIKLFSIGNVLNVVSAGLFNILFLLVLDMGVNGFFLSYILANVLTIIYVLAFGKISFNFSRKDKALFKKMVAYSTVLIPTNFMWWIMNSSDKVMIANFINPAANGVYAISYKIPMILAVVISVFNQAWFFSAVKEEDQKGREKRSNMAFDHLLKLSILINILILFILKPFTYIYVSHDFYASWQYVPILLFGFVFNTMATFVATTYSVEKNNKGMLFSGLFGAFCNIVLNFCLIPVIGVYGAAIATSSSYVAVFLYRLFDTKKSLHIKAFSLSHCLLYLVLIIANIACYLDNLMSYISLSVILLLFLIIIRKDILFYLKIAKGALLKWKRN